METPRGIDEQTTEALRTQRFYTEERKERVVREMMFQREKGVVGTAEWFMVNDDVLWADGPRRQDRLGLPRKMFDKDLCVYLRVLCASVVFQEKAFSLCLGGEDQGGVGSAASG
ncbi:MAG: hypothetical protein KatS3mg132_272 [Limisphaera sp.]|nr:MAG: hypothetical protein KatS3mg132_272 [Limisphaera sp.]